MQFPLLVTELFNAPINAWNKLIQLLKKPSHKYSPSCITSSETQKSTGALKKHIAVFYHKDTAYGTHYEKNHYFSLDTNSDLHESKLIKYILYPENRDRDDLIDFTPVFYPILFLKSFIYFISLNLCFSSFRSRKLSIRLSYYYFQYLSWERMLNSYELTDAIIDYDVLFPKPLSLALETQGVKTIAFQERPAFSMQNLLYGVITDVYFFSGNIWKRYANDRRSVIAQTVKSFAPWRASISMNAHIIYLNQTIISPLEKLTQNQKKIVFLGSFLSEESYVCCRTAIDKFLEYVSGVASQFPSSMILIRMKDLDKNTLDYLLGSVGSFSNIYISTDYQHSGLSYALCRDADVIVSVQTSLAEECLYYGKKVVFLDNIGSVINMCEDIYPPEFNFMYVASVSELIEKLNDIFDRKHCLLAKYKNLGSELLGDWNPYVENSIPLAIEEVLSRNQ